MNVNTENDFDFDLEDDEEDPIDLYLRLYVNNRNKVGGFNERGEFIENLIGGNAGDGSNINVGGNINS